MSEKRFTDVNVDFEESWIRLKDNGDFLIFPISFNDKEEYGLETLEDLLNGLSDKIDEQQATISALKDIFKDIITYSEWDSKKPYCSLRIAVDKKTYYKIRKILNE